MKKTALVLLALLALPGLCLAQTTGTYMPLPTSTPPTVPPPEPSVVDEAIKKIGAPAWSKPGFYLSGQIGAYGPADDQYEDEYNPDNGIAANAIFGYRINKFACLQAEIGYYDATGHSGFEFNALPIMGTLRLGVPFFGFDLYATGGLGAIFYKAEAYNFTTDQVEMGSHLGMGANYYFTDHFFLGFEGRYMMTDVNDAPNDGLMMLGQIGWKF